MPASITLARKRGLVSETGARLWLSRFCGISAGLGRGLLPAHRPRPGGSRGAVVAPTGAGVAVGRGRTRLLDDLVLARFGLVDVDALRKVCLGLYPYTLDLVALDRTLACEAWLRTMTPAPPATARGASR